ncbi:G-protein coupled receptor dmsr-1-like [Babylonia areolata]|uniref:G-protein coupled receptor dmsr-1-like n=1 Tax=Babylonia areolata TaxID=304850 RepID=UPI003FD1B756
MAMLVVTTFASSLALPSSSNNNNNNNNNSNVDWFSTIIATTTTTTTTTTFPEIIVQEESGSFTDRPPVPAAAAAAAAAVAAAMGNVTTTPTTLEAFQRGYSPIHGVVAPLICVLGIIANCLNIVVLTRKNMVSPTNVLLAALAISDGLTMAAYFPYAILNYHVYKYSYPPFGNAQYLMFFAIFSVIMHSISIWLTVSLAVFRYIFIRYPRQGVKLCSLQRANFTVVIVCIVVTIVCIPNSVSYELQYDLGEGNATSWYIDIKTDTPGYLFLKSFNLWVQAVLIKLLPCFLLSILSLLLIKQMKDAERRRKKLLNKGNGNKSSGGGGSKGSGGGGAGGGDSDESKRTSKSNRTTRMLVTVVVLFVVTETPQGILQLLGGVVDGFFNNIYGPLGDVMDTLALFNNGINFVLYCTMSKQFRDTFIKVFLRDLVSGTSGPKRTTTILMTTRQTDV